MSTITATKRTVKTTLLEKLEQTNDPVAVLNCERRHPRSYPAQLGGELWRQVKLGDQRRRQRIKCGLNESSVESSILSSTDEELSSRSPQRTKIERRTQNKIVPKLHIIPSLHSTEKKETVQALRPKIEFNRNFNTRLHYGSTIALESIVNGEFVAVGSGPRLEGYMNSRLPEACNYDTVFLFKLIELEDPCSAKAVQYGDHVWLQIHGGNGEPSWRNGSVIGARVREAVSLPIVPIALSNENLSCTKNTSPIKVHTIQKDEPVIEKEQIMSVQKMVGIPAPVRATLPKAQICKDEITFSFHEMHMRNRNACVIGRWRVLPATDESAARAEERGGYVYNNDPIYLEQDFFYICQDTNQNDHPLTLNRVPIIERISGSDFRVERRGIWNVRIAATSANLGEMSKTEQRTEILMDKARTSLHTSLELRQGRRKYKYKSHFKLPITSSDSLSSQCVDYIPGGDAFSIYLRENTRSHLAACENNFMKNRTLNRNALTKYSAEKSSFDHIHIDEHRTILSNQDSVVSAVTAPAYSYDSYKLTFPPPSQQWRLSNFQNGQHNKLSTDSDELTAAPISHTKSSFQEDSTEKKRSITPSLQLLGSSAWAYIMRQEDEFIASHLANGDLSPAEFSSGIPTASCAEPEEPHPRMNNDDTLQSKMSESLDDEDEMQGRATAKAIDDWFKKWTRITVLTATDHHIHKNLEEADDLVIRNIYFVKRRERFKKLFKQLELNDDESCKTFHTEDSIKDLGEINDIFQEQSNEPTKPLDIFLIPASIKCFQGNLKLFRDMCISSTRLLRATIIPKLQTTLENGNNQKAILSIIFEAVMLVLTFTECIIAPRLKASARKVKTLLVECLSPSIHLPDDQLFAIIAHCDDDINLMELISLTQHQFLSDLEAFVSHIQELDANNALTPIANDDCSSVPSSLPNSSSTTRRRSRRYSRRRSSLQLQ